MRWLKSILVALTLGLVAQPMAASPIQSTSLTYTDNGLTATFRGSHLQAFIRTDMPPGQSNYLSGGVLLTTIPHELLIANFSKPVVAWYFEIALFANTPDDVSLVTFLGGLSGTFVDQDFVTPGIPSPGGFVEGAYGFVGGGLFDTLVVTPIRGDRFAVDTIAAMYFDGSHYRQAVFRFNAPEPLTLALFGAGLAGVGAMRRKRKMVPSF